MAKQNLNHFVFNSDWPMDKIVFFKQTTVTVANGATQTVTIPHYLQFTPLPMAMCANSADFSDAKSFEPLPYDWGMNIVKADATNITVQIENGSGSTITVYLRVYGLVPETATQEATITSRQSSKLIFDTDKIYAPLIFSGVITEDFDSTKVARVNVSHGYKELTATAGRLIVEHDLGFLPYIMYWIEDANGVISMTGYPQFEPGTPLEYITLHCTTDEVQAYLGYSSNVNKWHIRIYANA